MRRVRCSVNLSALICTFFIFVRLSQPTIKVANAVASGAMTKQICDQTPFHSSEIDTTTIISFLKLLYWLSASYRVPQESNRTTIIVAWHLMHRARWYRCCGCKRASTCFQIRRKLRQSEVTHVVLIVVI